MAEREQVMSREPSTTPQPRPPNATAEDDEDDDESLDDLNGFLADVGRTLDTCEKPQQKAGYEETNAMLRDLHLVRQGEAFTLKPAVDATFQSDFGNLQPIVTGTVQRSTSQRRSAAQRAAAERLVQPQQHRAEQRVAPAPLIGSEDFYKHQQDGIRHYRSVYDARIGAHFDSLAAGTGMATMKAPRPTDGIGTLAYENASRHVAPISQLVRGSSDGVGGSACAPSWRPIASSGTTMGTAPAAAMSSAGSMLGFTSEKTAGRRGGRTGRSGSIHAALQAARSRGPML